MNNEQFNALRNAVLNALYFGAWEQAIGMLQGASIVANVATNNLHEWEQLFAWVNMAGSCAIDRKTDNAQRKVNLGDGTR